MIRIAEITENELHPKVYGGKAAGLSLLKKRGFQIPDGIAIEAVNNIDCLDQAFRKNLRKKLEKFKKNEKYVVAIRSSGTLEDSFTESEAGRYQTFLGAFSFEEVLGAIVRIVQSLYIPDSRMGVVIQRMIPSDYSGVVFSTDPLTYKKKMMVVSYVNGIGDKLVSGEVPGKDVRVTYEDEGNIKLDDNDSGFAEIMSLCQGVKKLEKLLGYPVDVEWSVCQGEIFYLQCRPLASITGIIPEFVHIDIENIRKILQRLKIKTKLNIWEKVYELGIRMPDTYVQIYNGSNALIGNIEHNITKSENCKGYSAVILYPDNSLGICHYLGDKMKVKGNLSNCCRYGIRVFPQYESIKECVSYYEEIIYNKAWIGLAMIQETIKPLYTGNICKVQNGYMVEITHGNFISKGIVPVSSYMISGENVVAKKETDQNAWYEVIEGHTVYCICNEGKDTLVSLPSNEIMKVLYYFRPLLEDINQTLEFAVLRHKETGEYVPYFIDFADSAKNSGLSLNAVSSGIMSQGKSVGEIVHVMKGDVPAFDKRKEEAGIVFFCQRPDIDLLPIIDMYSPERIAFVFEEGSVLCHVATVLREKGIPAVQIGHYQKWKYPSGKICEVDAQSENISGWNRVFVK